MNGERDMLSISTKPEILRSSPSTYRKNVKGCSPSKLTVCRSSLLSPSISKGQSLHSGRRGTRSTISETVLLPASSERKRLVGGKTPTKRTAIFTAPTEVNDDTIDEQQDVLLEPRNLERDLEMINGSSLSDESLHKHNPEARRQPTCSEKVSKWLEESQHSTLTDLTDKHAVSLNKDPEGTGRETTYTRLLFPDAYGCQHGTLQADKPLGSIPAELVAPIDDKLTKLKGFSLANLLIGYLKVVMCLSVVYVGYLFRIRPTSWDYYEPPPT